MARILLVLAAAAWGLGTVISRRAVLEIPPLALLLVQLTASVAVLAVFLGARGMPLRDRSIPPVLGRLGILNPGIAYGLSLIGLASISASLSVLLWAIEPILILLLAGWALREPIGPALLGLSGLAILGLVIVVGVPDGSGTLAGVALTLAGVGCCAVYTVIARRWLGETESTLQVVLAQQVYALAAAVVFVLAGAGFGMVQLPASISPTAWAGAIASGVLYYGAAYAFYLSGLRHVPASVAAASFYLVPAFGVAGGMLLLGERLSPQQWMGGALIVIVVAAILRSTRAASPDVAVAAQA